MEDVYSYLYTDSQDEVKPLKLFEGKVLLIFNFALHSSFLSSYVSNIEIAYRAMADLGFEVLSFPSSSFLKQNDEDTHKTIEYLKDNYQITFKVGKRIEDDAHNALLFERLALNKKFNGLNNINPLYETIDSYWLNRDPFYKSKNTIKWVFTSFVISRDGKIKKRYECLDDVHNIIKDIRKELDR